MVAQDGKARALSWPGGPDQPSTPVVSFFFNTVIVAAAVNLAVSLGS